VRTSNPTYEISGFSRRLSWKYSGHNPQEHNPHILLNVLFMLQGRKERVQTRYNDRAIIALMMEAASL
jgi:hypothetical protein